MYSSTTFNNFNVRPSTVVSNWKSSAHRTFGRIGHIAPTATPTPRCGFFRFRYGTFSPSSRPQAMHPLVVDRPALATKLLRGAAPSPPRPSPRETPQPRPEFGFIVTADGWVEPLRRSVLPDDPARSPLGDLEPVAQRQPRCADDSGSDVSFSQLLEHRLVQLRVREQPLHRPFSISSSLSRFASFAVMPPHCAIHPMPRRLGDLEMAAHHVELGATG